MNRNLVLAMALAASVGCADIVGDFDQVTPGGIRVASSGYHVDLDYIDEQWSLASSCWGYDGQHHGERVRVVHAEGVNSRTGREYFVTGDSHRYGELRGAEVVTVPDLISVVHEFGHRIGYLTGARGWELDETLRKRGC